MKKLIYVPLLTSLVFGVAYAAKQEESQSKPTSLTFQELKEACTNPARFHNQIPPKDIKVRCQDSRMVWAPLQQKQFEMKAQRQVKTSLISDKYQVVEQSNEVPLQATQGACPQFQEVSQGVVTEKKVTCDEIIAHQGTLNDFCLDAIEKSLAENKDIMNEKATGRIYTTCKGQVIDKSGNIEKGMEQQDLEEEGQDLGQAQDELSKEPSKLDSKEPAKPVEIVGDQGELQDEGQLQGQEQQDEIAKK